LRAICRNAYSVTHAKSNTYATNTSDAEESPDTTPAPIAFVDPQKDNFSIITTYEKEIRSTIRRH
jgi:hypothetical protein